jgi:hypothetical protein
MPSRPRRQAWRNMASPSALRMCSLWRVVVGALPQQGPTALSPCPQNNPARGNPLWRTIVSNAPPGQFLNIALAEAAPWEAHAANAVSCPFDPGRLHSRFDAHRRPLIYSVGSCSNYAQNDGSGEQQAHGGPPGRSSSLTPHRLILMLQKWLRFIQRAAKSTIQSRPFLRPEVHALASLWRRSGSRRARCG